MAEWTYEDIFPDQARNKDEPSRSPRRVSLKIIDIAGGEGVRRRLFSLGFHKGDEVECRARGILGGPVVIKNLRSGVTAAVGRGIARKIRVEVRNGTP